MIGIALPIVSKACTFEGLIGKVSCMGVMVFQKTHTPVLVPWNM